MNLGNPLLGLFPAVESKILVEMTRTRDSLTGRNVARRVGGSHSTVLRGLQRLERQGILRVERAGSAKLYSVNWKHLSIDPILDLVELKATLFRAIADQIDGWSIQPEKVSVFGSAARLDADADSDVDILVVRAKGIEPDNSDWNGQVSDLSASVFDWTGNRASIVEIPYSTLHEWTGLNTPRIAQEIGKDEIPLVGPRMSSLLSG